MSRAIQDTDIAHASEIEIWLHQSHEAPQPLVNNNGSPFAIFVVQYLEPQGSQVIVSLYQLEELTKRQTLQCILKDQCQLFGYPFKFNMLAR